MKRISKWLNIKNYAIVSIVLWQLMPDGIPLPLPLGFRLDIRRSICLSLAALWLITKFIKMEPLRIFWNAPTKLLTLFIFMRGMSSVLFSHEVSTTLLYWADDLGLIFIIYFILSDKIETLDDCKKILTVIAITSIVLSIYTFYEIKHGNPRDMYRALAVMKDDAISTGRVHASFSDPISFANYLSMTLFIIVYKIFQSKSIKLIFFWGISLATSSMALLMSVTKGTIIPTGLFFVLFTILCFKLNGRKAALWAVLAGSITIGLLSIVPLVMDMDFFIARFQVLTSSSESVGERSIPAKRFLSIIIMDFLLKGFGVGCMHQYDLFIKSYGSNPIADMSSASFPIYYIFAIESGLISLIVYFFMMLSTLKYIMETVFFERDYEKRLLAFALVFVILNFSVAMIFSQNKETLFIFFIFLAVAQYVSQQKRVLVRL